MTDDIELNDQYIAKYKAIKLIKELSGSKGNGTSLITLIIPGSTQISKIQQMLLEEYGTATNIKDHCNKLSVQSGIKSAQEKLKLYNKIPQNGLVICTGTIINEYNKEKKITRAFEPIKAINKSLYRCDNKFHVDDLILSLSDDQKFGFIIVDGSGALYALLAGENKEILSKISVDLPKKHRKGGQSAQRFGRIRLEKRHRYLTKVSDLATQVFITNDLPNVDGLILAGSSVFKNDIIKNDLLDYRLRPLIKNIIDINYGGEYGLEQAILLSKDTITNAKYIKEEKLLSNYFYQIERGQNNISYGINHTMAAFDNMAVDKLIIWEKLNIKRYEIYNKNTQLKSIVYVDYLENNNDFDIINDDLLINWLLDVDENNKENYKQWCKTLFIVTDHTPLGSQFTHGFGGLGAFLRFSFEYEMLNVNNNDDFNDDDFI
jgi:peptide chain release factor subunit 1